MASTPTALGALQQSQHLPALIHASCMCKRTEYRMNASSTERMRAVHYTADNKLSATTPDCIVVFIQA